MCGGAVSLAPSRKWCMQEASALINLDQSASPPTARALPLDRGISACPVGQLWVRLHQSSGWQKRLCRMLARCGLGQYSDDIGTDLETKILVCVKTSSADPLNRRTTTQEPPVFD